MSDVANAELEIRVGQVWREVDGRRERYIRVRGLRAETIDIETVYNADGKWFRCHGTRVGLAARNRFNGKRGGYALQEDAK